MRVSIGGAVVWSIVAAALVSAAGGTVWAADETLVAAGAACRYQVPTNGADGTNWTAAAFDDSGWSTGTSGVGYDTESGTPYVPLINTWLAPGTVGAYLRFAFNVPAGKSYNSLLLRLKYEDGFVAYLNGVEVGRGNVPASVAFDSTALSNRDDAQAVMYQTNDLTAFLPQVKVGANVLAIHLMNLSSGSSDLLMVPELVAGAPDAVQEVTINEFMAVNDSTRKNSLGKYEDWVELYNPLPTNVNLRGWYLTDNASKLTKWQFPNHAASVVASKGYLLVWTDSKSYSVTNSELHTSFSLSGDGEYLGLVKPDGATVVSAFAPTFPPQYGDISYGIGQSGESRYFAVPTPGAVNAFAGASNQVEGVKFSPKRGVYTNAMPPLTVTASMSGSEIRYTTDLSEPTATNALYTAPLAPDKTTVYRAAAFKSGFAPSTVDTHSYLSADDVLRQPAAPAGYPSTWSGYAADYEMAPAVVAANGAALTNALKALPSLSLVTSISNLFDASTGIYTHPGSLGTNWEREISAEWIEADNDSKFQIGCGLQIQGGAFRGFNLSMKKSFSLQFRDQYGAGKLYEDLFTDGAVSWFDDLVLRAGANDAWDKWPTDGSNHDKKQYIVDEFVRQVHRNAGGCSPHGRFIHVYLNGLYWGVYNVTEKVSGEFASAYVGGREDTWDVRSQDAALDGDYTAWNAMVNLLPTNGVSNAVYQQVQGNNADGSRNPAYPVYLDVEDYIDYLIVQYWSSNTDWPGNNWRAFRDRAEAVSTGFKFSIWDAEAGVGVWGDLTADKTADYAGAAVPQGRLISNAEYKLRFADRAQKHLFNGGALTPQATVPIYQELAAKVEPALVAEIARWSDQDGRASHTMDEWRVRRDYVLNSFLQQRGANVLQHFRNRGLYPSVAAPVLSQHGGAITNSLSLGVTSAQPVYYTLDGSDPRQYGTGTAVGTLYTNSIPLSRTARVKARARSAGGEWSALVDAVFTLDEKPALRVSELMYHPAAASASGGELYVDGDDEFIELQNAGGSPVGLAGLRFTQGVAFDFTEGAVQTLNPGERVLVVKNLAAFTNRYPSVSRQRIAGAFAFPLTSLANSGDTLKLEDALGRTVVSFTYSDAWRVETDGAGHSLVPKEGVAQDDGQLDYPGNWVSSVYLGGSPGEAEPAAPAASLVLNEILAHTDVDSPPYDSNDGIELYNVGGSTVALGEGWYLSDDPADLKKWAIPATNTVAAHGWRYFDEMTGFHVPITNGFGLNKAGEQVLLSYLPAAGAGRVVDAVSFAGAENGVPLVRFPDGAAAWVDGVSTPGASNALAAVGVRIDELVYHPAPTFANPENNENDEYVELFNPTAQAVTLEDLVDGAGTWRLSGGIDYDFPAGTVLPAGGRLVLVSFDPVTNTAARDAFFAAYGLTNGQARLLGPFSGQLNNKTDSVRLERPVSPDVSGDEPSWHVVDQVAYYDGSPWPVEADGTGRPLARRPGRGSGEEASSWVAGLTASPGGVSAKVAVSSPAAFAGFRAPGAASVAAVLDETFVAGAAQRVVFALDGVDAATVAEPPYAATVALPAFEGERTLTARLTDAEGDSLSLPVPISTYTNLPGIAIQANPAVNLTMADGVGLHALASLLAGMTNALSYSWSCPGSPSVVIERADSPDAAARFGAPGTYELVLTVGYGRFETNYAVTVVAAVTNTVNRVPYRDAFEHYEVGSTLVGVGGWHAASPDVVLVETNRFSAAPASGQPIPGTHERSLTFCGSASNQFTQTSALTNLCVDMLMSFDAGGDVAPEPASDAQIAFWVNESRRMLVWHGQTGGTNRWSELPDVILATNTSVRLTVQADYTRDVNGSYKFRVWVDRVPVTRPSLWFTTASTNRNCLVGVGMSGMGQIDDLVVDAYNSMLYRRITAAAGANGSVSPAGEFFVPVGGSTNVAILPNAYYGVASVSVDGLAVGPVRTYAFTNVWDEHALQAEFAASLTSSGVPELWLNRLNPAWTDNFEAHAQADQDGDGSNNAEEYVAGTDATNALSVFRLSLDWSEGGPRISFPTVAPGGQYGEGGVRRYSLEQSDDVASGTWQGLPGMIDVAGWGQPVVYTNSLESAPRRFFRGKVRLSP